MKTKRLHLIIAAVAISCLGLSAQKLLVSENFSTSAWETEFARLNPGYTTPAPNSTATVFISGIYNGFELFSGTIEAADGTLSCEDGSTIHNINGSAVAWRLKRQTSGVSYLTLPRITSAGTFTIHAKSGGAATKLQVQRVDTVEGVAVATKLKELTITRSDHEKYATQLDEIKTYWVDSRDPITLRIGQQAGGLFIKIFGFEVEEHATVPLKQSIDSANVILTNNASNIGVEFGQYPQAVYDSLQHSVTNANVVFNELTSTKESLISSSSNVDQTITYFKANVNDVNVGLQNPKAINLKQNGRTLTVDKATRISIFNTMGSLVFVSDQVKEIQVPTSVGNGIFLVRTSSGTEKIFLNN